MLHYPRRLTGSAASTEHKSEQNIDSRLLHLSITVAESAYYKRLWACISVKSLTNIGSCGLRFSGLVFIPHFLFLVLFNFFRLKKKDVKLQVT